MTLLLPAKSCSAVTVSVFAGVASVLRQVRERVLGIVSPGLTPILIDEEPPRRLIACRPLTLTRECIAAGVEENALHEAARHNMGTTRSFIASNVVLSEDVKKKNVRYIL
jgi:hypothetical protein